MPANDSVQPIARHASAIAASPANECITPRIGPCRSNCVAQHPQHVGLGLAAVDHDRLVEPPAQFQVAGEIIFLDAGTACRPSGGRGPSRRCRRPRADAARATTRPSRRAPPRRAWLGWMPTVGDRRGIRRRQVEAAPARRARWWRRRRCGRRRRRRRGRGRRAGRRRTARRRGGRGCR